MFARALSAVVGAAALITATALPAAAAPISGAAEECTSGGGVWVVVDTGQKVIAADCAMNPTSGLDALAKIGVKTQSAPGGVMCAIDGQPEGLCAKDGFDKETQSFWSYWSRPVGKPGWEFAQLGPDQSKPAAGSLEGWRYGDGTPANAPAEHFDRVAPASDQDSSGGQGPWAIIGVVVLLALLAAAFFVVRARSRKQKAGGAPDDQGPDQGSGQDSGEGSGQG